MSETSIATYVDGIPHEWKLAGELSLSSEIALSPAQQMVFERFGKEGYTIIPAPPSIHEALRHYI